MPRTEKVDPRLCAVYKDTSDLVGIDTPRDELVKLPSDEDGELKNQLKIVSIVGTGGLGKTTLARQVYNKPGANFDCRAFVSISRSPNMPKILSSILSQLRNQDQNHAGVGDPELLIDHIREFLKDKSYLELTAQYTEAHGQRRCRWPAHCYSLSRWTGTSWRCPCHRQQNVWKSMASSVKPASQGR